jgi:hypothetical protein
MNWPIFLPHLPLSPAPSSFSDQTPPPTIQEIENFLLGVIRKGNQHDFEKTKALDTELITISNSVQPNQELFHTIRREIVSELQFIVDTIFPGSTKSQNLFPNKKF